MCMHIDADLWAIYESIYFIFGTLIGLYVSHKALKFQVNIFNSF